MSDTLIGESPTNRIGHETPCRIHIFYTGFIIVPTYILFPLMVIWLLFFEPAPPEVLL